MKTQQKVTPLTIQHFYKNHNQYWEIKDSKDNFLARCFDYESAAYIVKCVNSHEQLIAALKAAKIFLIDDNYYQEAKYLIATIDEALAESEV